MKTTAALCVFILACLLSSARLVVDAPSIVHPPPDEIGQRSDQRFAALKAALPNRGVVGYVGESGNVGLADYYLAQYELAPLVVERSGSHSLVIGNFHRKAEAPANLRLIHDFGNGVLLFAQPDSAR